MELKVVVTQKGKLFEGKGQEIVNQKLTEAMYKATSFLEREVKKRTPQGVFGTKGGLRSTIHGEVVGKGTPVVKGIVAHQSKYGDVIEKGRRPGQKMPPSGALFDWIALKWGSFSDIKTRQETRISRKRADIAKRYQRIARKRGVEAAEYFQSRTINTTGIRRLEFIIRKKIAIKGFPGKHMFEKALTENWGKIQTIFDKAGFEIARELNE